VCARVCIIHFLLSQQENKKEYFFIENIDS
jgi:hypothetical protein